jgi:hypothetical protein
MTWKYRLEIQPLLSGRAGGTRAKKGTPLRLYNKTQMVPSNYVIDLKLWIREYPRTANRAHKPFTSRPLDCHVSSAALEKKTLVFVPSTLSENSTVFALKYFVIKAYMLSKCSQSCREKNHPRFPYNDINYRTLVWLEKGCT